MREALKGNDTEAMKKTYDDLQNKFQEISAELYKQAAASAGVQRARCRGRRRSPGPQGEPQADGPRKDQGDVVDAEFEVVDEDKK